MIVQKCDSCKKTIKGKMVLAGYSEYSMGNNILCTTCGKPVLEFLKTKGFLKEDRETSISANNKRK